MLEPVERQLRAAGMKVKIDIYEPGVYEQRQQHGNFDISIRGGTTASDPSPALRPEYYSEKGVLRSANLAGWRDQRTDEPFDKMDSIIDPDQRFKIYQELANYLYEQVPYLNLGFETRFFGSAEYVMDFQPTVTGGYVHKNGGLKRTWLNK